jgi:plasmid segregation protein ParM
MITDFNKPDRPVHYLAWIKWLSKHQNGSCLFQAGVTRTSMKPHLQDGLMFYEGIYYTIGEEHKEFIADKMNDQDYFILTLAVSLANCPSTGGNQPTFHLAVGLPLTWVVEQRTISKST